MLLDDDFREIVGYLMVDHRGHRVAVGTVFFLSLSNDVDAPEIPPDAYVSYCVTARHLFQKQFKKLYIRGRGMPEIETDREQWIFHPKTDLAVCRLADIDAGRTAKLYTKHPTIRPGKDVFMVGLFDPLQTQTSDVEPVARFGHIALSKIKVKLILDLEHPKKLTEVEVRLIETRSWGGESGSPVFVHSQYYQPPSGGTYGSAFGSPWSSGHFYSDSHPQKSEVRASQTDYELLGILHGHFEVERPTEANQSGLDQRIVDMNAGIAAVIPVEDLREFLMKDKRLVDDRKQQPKRKANAPVPDSKLPGPAFTKGDFENALRKVAHRITPTKPEDNS